MTNTSATPALSIGMPVYNGARYIVPAIEALLAQTFTDFELVISDNASTDATGEICLRYAERDARIVYIRQEQTSSAVENFLFLLHRAKSAYFMWAASDDQWHPAFCERLMAAHRARPEIVVAFSPYILTDADGVTFGAVRAPDYAGASPVARIERFCEQWDDAFIYGIFRREVLDGFELPTWWGMNSGTPLNTAYPPLGYILAQGDYALVGDEPMWFNRQHDTKTYVDRPFGNRVVDSAAYILRQVNVGAECLSHVYRARRSPRTVLEVLPAVTARVSKGIGRELYGGGRAVVRAARRAISR